MRFKDIIGQRFGRLVVVENMGFVQGRKRQWRCVCDCGNETTAPSKHLLDGHKRSCGCWSAENRAKPKPMGHNRRPPGVAAMHVYYTVYRSSAEDRGWCFELTEDQFAEIVQQSCYYCGTKPSRQFGYETLNGFVVCNGIDRIDNTKGYILDNARPCCKRCNYLKGQRSVGAFLDLIRDYGRIAAHLGLV